MFLKLTLSKRFLYKMHILKFVGDNFCVFDIILFPIILVILFQNNNSIVMLTYLFYLII